MKLPIPQDWDGNAKRCYRVTVPASVGWHILFTGIVGGLARGRMWNENTGDIRGAQAAGLAIFDSIRDCEPDGEAVAEKVVYVYCAGGDANEEGDEMGVTKVYVDYETSELVVQSGQCCEQRFSLANPSGVIGSGDDTEWPGLPELPGGVEYPLELPDYTACGKAEYFVGRLETIGRAAWNNRTTPWDVAGGIKDANPGYSVSMVPVTSLYVAMLELGALEAVTDTDIFGAEFFTALKCKMAGYMADGEAKGLSDTEWTSLILGWLTFYPFTSENPELDILGDLLVNNFWTILIQQVLSPPRCNQIIAEAVGVEGDCSDCYGGAPVTEDWDWEIVYDFTLDEQGFTMAAGEGTGWQAGSGWFRIGGGDDAFLRIGRGTKTGPFSGVLTYASLEFNNSGAEAGSEENEKGVWFDGQSGVADVEGVITYTDINDALADGVCVVTKQMQKGYSCGSTGYLGPVIQCRLDYGGADAVAYRKLTLRGTGDPIANPAVV